MKITEIRQTRAQVQGKRRSPEIYRTTTAMSTRDKTSPETYQTVTAMPMGDCLNEMGNKIDALFESIMEPRSVRLCSNANRCLKSISKKPYQSRNWMIWLLSFLPFGKFFKILRQIHQEWLKIKRTSGYKSPDICYICAAFN